MPEGAYGEAKCPVCASPFTKRRPNQKYDKDECRHSAFNVRFLRAMKANPFPGPPDLVIQKYASHTADCNSRSKATDGAIGYYPCNCGFSNAMGLYQESLKNPGISVSGS